MQRRALDTAPVAACKAAAGRLGLLERWRPCGQPELSPPGCRPEACRPQSLPPEAPNTGPFPQPWPPSMAAMVRGRGRRSLSSLAACWRSSSLPPVAHPGLEHLAAAGGVPLPSGQLDSSGAGLAPSRALAVDGPLSPPRHDVLSWPRPHASVQQALQEASEAGRAHQGSIASEHSPKLAASPDTATDQASAWLPEGQQHAGAGTPTAGHEGHSGRPQPTWPVHFSGAKRGPIAVAISGGVDSAVAAMLLKQQGHELFGVFMRNWDESEELGNQNCSVEQDRRDAQQVCRKLGIPLHEADFVDKYWHAVFAHFLQQHARGVTPNPDLACNRYIKFDALLRFARDLGATAVATGHYARLRPAPAAQGDTLQLLRGLDPDKDQTYFLASVPGAALQHCLFPVGDLRKQQVRALAAEAGLVPPGKRSSAGICFIGRRDFGDFMSQYVEPVPGQFVDVDTGRVLGPCSNTLAVTWGQRSAIGGMPDRTYVVGKDMAACVVYVAQGQGHPALLTRGAQLHSATWVSGQPPPELAAGEALQCLYQARYRYQVEGCRLANEDANGSSAQQHSLGAGWQDLFAPSRFCHLPQTDDQPPAHRLHVSFDPALAITPEQAFVLYQGEVCLGSALVQHPAATLFEADTSHVPEHKLAVAH